ncbi:uncharacterized protein LOC142576267 isoform X1 [Dermacentor variabilis]|uniref:uncharacterized protein LOC142576267 isoform X1 n=1 Tax=Dermacentor variabilis TaxID=34621 RepID=UPI003F5C085F
MNTFIYAAAISFAVLVHCEQLNVDSSSDDYDYSIEGCPFLVAENKTGFGTPVVCSQNCSGVTETVQNGERCFSSYCHAHATILLVVELLQYACVHPRAPFSVRPTVKICRVSEEGTQTRLKQALMHTEIKRKLSTKVGSISIMHLCLVLVPVGFIPQLEGLQW